MHQQTVTTPISGDPCATAWWTSAEQAPVFPPRDADAATYRAWLARAAWPEVVFGARLPASRV